MFLFAAELSVHISVYGHYAPSVCLSSVFCSNKQTPREGDLHASTFCGFDMDKYAPKFSTVLLTQDPHYIPGYAGYCPQLKFNMGKSYGQLTAELLSSPSVRHSNHLVLHTGYVPLTESGTGLTLRTTPDSNLKTMIPGYTGFIPRSQNVLACSYSETCRRALTEFYEERHGKLQQQSVSLPTVVNYTNQQFERSKPTLTAISNKVISNKPLKPFTPIGKPYFMEDDNPHKYFISGFTGHVPKSRFLIGKGYPITTNQALIQFRKQQQQQSAPVSHDNTRKDSTTLLMPIIYPSDKGVVPSFTGHIPGFKFMHGHTFGQLSQNALEKSGIRRTFQETS
uniref:Ciliary microtubule inner protein 2B n=1 Tax=Monopterus albus TaxID=43700 RepID=A0A3Q3K709_MONAL|nr:protein FAM166B-like [Monopterus albus]